MSAWGVGMQANDTVLDAIGPFRNYEVKGLPLNKKGQAVVDGKAPLFDVLVQAVKKNTWDPDMSILGLTEFFLDQGAVIDADSREYVLEAIKRELRPKQLERWAGDEGRKAALRRFRDRIMGKPADSAAVAQDNEGLISRMSRARDQA